MKMWIAAAAALAMSIGQAYAEDHIDGVFDGRSIPGWSYRTVDGTASWLLSDGSSNTSHAICNLIPVEGAATLQAWQSTLPANAEDFAALSAGRAGITAHPGSRLSQLVIAGHPAFRFEMSFSTQRGEEQRMLQWRIAGVEATLNLHCFVLAQYWDQALPQFEAFASGLSVLTTAPR